MKIAEARERLIAEGNLLEGGPEDHSLRAAEELLKQHAAKAAARTGKHRGSAPHMTEPEVLALLQHIVGVPEPHVALHIHKHEHLGVFCEDLGMGDDHRDRTHRAAERFTPKMSESDITHIVLEYLNLPMPNESHQ
jgi:hypothetical protein